MPSNKAAISLQNLSTPAAVAIEPHRFINVLGTYNGAGVSIMKAAIGDLVSATVYGTAIVECAGTIAKGAFVDSDASGMAIAFTTGIRKGIALDAGVAGAFIEVLLK